MLQLNVKVAVYFYTHFQHYCKFTCVLFRVSSEKYYPKRNKGNTFNAWLTLKYASSDTNYSHPCDAALGLLIVHTYNCHAKLIQNIKCTIRNVQQPNNELHGSLHTKKLISLNYSE